MGWKFEIIWCVFFILTLSIFMKPHLLSLFNLSSVDGIQAMLFKDFSRRFIALDHILFFSQQGVQRNGFSVRDSSL